MNKVKELRECPFCGGEAELHLDYGNIGDSEVFCMYCGIHGNIHTNDPDGSDATTEWNKRV